MKTALSRSLLGFLTIALLWSAVPDAQGDSKISEPKAIITLADDFSNLGLQTITILERPHPTQHPEKAAVLEGICAELQKAGYQVDNSPTSLVRLTVSTELHKGPSLIEFARKMGYEEGNIPPVEDYWLSVHVALTVKQREVYTAKCRMWHKFIPTEREHKGVLGTDAWPIDEIGEGPATMQKAILEIAPLLMSRLPARK